MTTAILITLLIGGLAGASLAFPLGRAWERQWPRKKNVKRTKR